MEQELRRVYYDPELGVEACLFQGIDQGFPEHFHTYYVIGTMDRGSREVTIAGETRRLAPGELVFFQPGEPHACRPVGEERLDWRGLHVPQEVMEQQLGTLSGGQRRRIELARILFSNADTLILDEPTNHLDIASKEILENALNDYTGTVLYVSHDRYFINQTASRILDLVNHTFVNYIGNYDYYLEKKEELTTAYAGVASTSSSVSDNSTDKNVSESKLSWQEQKEAQARLRKRQNELKKTEERIGELEDRDSEIDALMIQEDIFTNSVKCQELAKEKAAIAEELEELYMKWEELAEDA